MSNPLNKITLAYNAARAKAALIRQEAKVKRLNDELIERVGTGGETIQTSLGQVIISAETETRPSGNTVVQFDMMAYNDLRPQDQAYLISLGVVKMVATTIQGQAPRVSFRLNS